MALETWLIKVKKTISNTAKISIPKNSKASKHVKSTVGVLSFEIAGLMSKLLHLWTSLSDKNVIRLRDESVSLEGVRKIVSNDESFLLGLACAEIAENVRLLAKYISRISTRCQDSGLQCFDRWFNEFANSGHDTHGWVLSSKEMEAKNKKMDPLKNPSEEENKDSRFGFFESNTKLLKPPASTLGAAALALHYANLIIIIEKMIKSPQLVGVDARDDLYSMLPNSIRSSLRGRLKGVGFSAGDPILAGEWRTALGRILGWLSPLAHNMIKWQSERSFEQQNLLPKTNVLLLQTLFFANKDKTEAAITELLVGLNYIWRFEREMTAKALFECSNFNVQS
ncbi:hypothetical protein GOBAR_AA36303 [Gossypium barbadense]|uniref:DUF668 domain-containing protein n=1 Tax=Gossypium barbadense TaxID=3634 RepID=A0A2P5VZZ9_GOSBA|nr:hypothetical protein GOBAR_AA36303 [Gossypium barbadense]